MISYNENCLQPFEPHCEEKFEKVFHHFNFDEVAAPVFYASAHQVATQQQNVNITNVIKENEILKKRLEMSEKLLFKLMNTGTPADPFFSMFPCPDIMAFQTKGEAYPTLD